MNAVDIGNEYVLNTFGETAIDYVRTMKMSFVSR